MYEPIRNGYAFFYSILNDYKLITDFTYWKEPFDIEFKCVDDISQGNRSTHHEYRRLHVWLLLEACSEEPSLVFGQDDLHHVRLWIAGEDGSVGEVPHVDVVTLSSHQGRTVIRHRHRGDLKSNQVSGKFVSWFTTDLCPNIVPGEGGVQGPGAEVPHPQGAPCHGQCHS